MGKSGRREEEKKKNRHLANAVEPKRSKDNSKSKKTVTSRRKNGKKSDNGPKILSDRRKWLVKKRNKLIVILYLIFCVYVFITFFTWKGMAESMMKNVSSVIVDNNGNIIVDLGKEKMSEPVDISKVPDNLKNAYIDIEDERFYSHQGVDVKRTTSAIFSYVIHKGKSSFGGSTITQQLVKNLTGNDDNKASRKIEEWKMAYELESFTTKDQVLQAYLNIIYMAPKTYGVEMGSKYYFNKSVSDLSLAECAFLAGINNSPNSYNPFGKADNSEKIKVRSKAVLGKMLEKKHISQDDYNLAVQEIENGIKFNHPDIVPESDGIYSYHTDALLTEVISDVAKKKHISVDFATNYVYMGGLKIYSTVDNNVQSKMEKEYAKEKNIITSSSGEKAQSAMIVVDHKTGYVVGCVGGLGKKNTSRGFNRATKAVRQTGSAIKPIAVLVPGLEKKLFTAATIYNDAPTTFNQGTIKEYAPTDNDDYIGEITVRRAVESSQNIPFVKMMEQITPKRSIQYMKKMGITTLTDKDEELTLALGGLDKGITPLEMAGAYAALANNGEYIEPTFYTKVENSDGHKILKSKQKKNRVCSEEVASLVTNLLKQPVEGGDGTAKACRISGMDVAAKTGTTNENYDKWLCGYTTYYTAVTWYGYDQNQTIEYRGKSPAVLLWADVIKSIHQELPKTNFTVNSRLKPATVCAKTGLTSSVNCSDTYTEYFLSGTIPGQCDSCTGGKKTTRTVTKTKTPEPTAEVTKAEPTQEPTKANNVTNKNTTNKNTTNSEAANNTNTKTNKTDKNTVNNTTNTGKNNTVKNTTKTPTVEDEEDDGP